jgi:spore maturation protein CgeB
LVISANARSFYGCDVSFVGAWSPKKQRLLESVLRRCPDLSVHSWGTGWHKASRRVLQRWRHRGVYGDELALVYGCSTINLGLLSEAGTGTQSGDLTTARTWQIPASGGFMLHEATDELARYFEPGREVAVFSTPDELASSIRHYLGQAEERCAIANAGLRKTIESNYTHDKTAKVILEFSSKYQQFTEEICTHQH